MKIPGQFFVKIYTQGISRQNRNEELSSLMNPRKKIKRSELHRMVWEEALSKLGPKLDLSDVGLRKICKRHNIPLPPQGDWARSPDRRSPKRTPLPQPDKDWDLEFVIQLQVAPENQSELDETFGPPSGQALLRDQCYGSTSWRDPGVSRQVAMPSLHHKACVAQD